MIFSFYFRNPHFNPFDYRVTSIEWIVTAIHEIAIDSLQRQCYPRQRETPLTAETGIFNAALLVLRTAQSRHHPPVCVTVYIEVNSELCDQPKYRSCQATLQQNAFQAQPARPTCVKEGFLFSCCPPTFEIKTKQCPCTWKYIRQFVRTRVQGWMERQVGESTGT